LFWGLVGEREFELAVYHLGDGLAGLLTGGMEVFGYNSLSSLDSNSFADYPTCVNELAVFK
jgi:hypothetical protein